MTASAGAVLEVNASDDQLVAAARDGSDRAFEELYARYRRRIGGYVAGMVGDHGRAEDVTQEVFVSALRRMRATERPIAFKPWIYEIARNACIDEYRRTRRFSDDVSFDAEDGSTIAGEAGVSPDVAIQAKQQIDDLMGAFGGLSDAHHEILVMRELEGRSYSEIGDRLGMSRPSVESTLFRARRRLSEEYEDLVSGERCRRVDELLASGVASLGIRDERRLARHVAHCQPCRRAAYAAGVDAETLTRHRRDLRRRIAGLFPVPAFLRLSQLVSPVAEPAAGWSKAVAAAAVLAAGSAGIVAHDAAPAPHHATRSSSHSAAAAPATGRASAAAVPSGMTAVLRHFGAASGPKAPTRKASKPSPTHHGSVPEPAEAAAPSLPAVPDEPVAPPTQQLATAPPVAAATQGVPAITDPDAPAIVTSTDPSVDTGTTGEQSGDPVTEPVQRTTEDLTDTADETTEQTTDTTEEATDPVDPVVEQATGTVEQATQPVEPVVEQATEPVEQATEPVEPVVEQATGTVEQATQPVEPVVEQATGTVEQAAGDAGAAVDGAVGGLGL